MMLKHEDHLETPAQTAAQARVTPQELAAALARLEARQGGLDGTIPLGDAVQELGLNATPEELLREIEAGRARHQTSSSLTRRAKAGLAGAAALIGVPVLLGGLFTLRSGVSPPPAPVATLAVAAAPQAVPKPISLDSNLPVRDTSGKLVLLSEVGDNQPVHCRYFDGRFLQSNPQDNYESWELIKHDGQVYVRGQILKMSPKVFLSEGVDVTTVGDDPAFAIPITLPVKGFNVVPGAGSYVEFHALNIHLDKHAYEKWEQ